ncbi:uncharacterized protein LOC126980680 [Eriocheir sinensis]|uniref:uncharacterized protein LOC126980680 n=1 Tax=Eriocheir sinensis TaxID=95602 RepID=UPI0021C9631F|nr:uncharacterized protein LOC126980680 [Eriocheir sinensis]
MTLTVLASSCGAAGTGSQASQPLRSDEWRQSCLDLKAGTSKQALRDNAAARPALHDKLSWNGESEESSRPDVPLLPLFRLGLHLRSLRKCHISRSMTGGTKANSGSETLESTVGGKDAPLTER